MHARARRLGATARSLAIVAASHALGCGGGREPLRIEAEPGTGEPPSAAGSSEASSDAGAAEDDGGHADEGGGPLLDIGDPPHTPGACLFYDTCHWFDVLIVVDNSSSMANKQHNIAANAPLIIDTLDRLTDNEGAAFVPDVHLMVTTGDIGHPLCPLEPGYAPAMGAPQTTACIDRLDDFGEGSPSAGSPARPRPCAGAPASSARAPT